MLEMDIIDNIPQKVCFTFEIQVDGVLIRKKKHTSRCEILPIVKEN